MELGRIEDMLKYVKEYNFPTDILVETTTFCNLKCNMCPNRNLARPRGEMSHKLWEKIVKEVVEVAPATVLWPTIMGEPMMLGKRIFEYIKYAKDLGIKKICLNSNFLLFSEELVVPLFDSDLDELIIGLDAVTEDTYKKIRISGDFNKVIKNVDLFILENEKRCRPIKLTIQMVLQDENIDEEQLFIDYWRNKASGICLKIRHRIGWGGSVAPSSMINKSDLENRIACLWILRQMSILWNGLVPQCDCPGERYYGDVNKQSLSEIWNGQLRELRQRHLAGDFSLNPCKNCHDWRVGKSVTINI